MGCVYGDGVNRKEETLEASGKLKQLYSLF